MSEAIPSASLVRIDDIGDGVHVITLANGKVNALSVELLDQLHGAAGGLADSDSPPRAVVVAGNQKVFAAGADITQFAERGGEEPFEISSSERVAEIGASFLGALGAVASLPCPTIAAVSGAALGGGCELALACDFRIAGARARFGQPEILLGIIPGGGGTQRLARLIGPARAKDLVFTGRTVDAAEALRIGLVDEVVDDEQEVVEVAIDRARAFASGPRAAIVLLAKQAIDEGLEGSLADGLELEQRLFVASFGLTDADIGVRSFLRDGPGKADFN